MKKIKPETLSRKTLLLAFMLVFVAIGTYLVVKSKAAGNATITLTPATQTVNLGQTFNVNVVVNTGTVEHNAVQADLNYDQTKIEYVTLAAGTNYINRAVYGLTVQDIGSNGVVNMAAASLTPLTGQQTFATVTFRAIGTGVSPITVASSSGIAPIVAQGSDGILGSTTPTTITIRDVTAPTVPVISPTTSSTVNSTSFNWSTSTDNVGVTGYKVYRGGTLLRTVTTTSFNDTGLTPNIPYQYRVSAVDAAGNESAQSTAVTITTLRDTAAPTVPQSVRSTGNTLNSISITWNASTDNVAVSGYNVYRDGVKVGSPNGLTFTDSGLVSGRTYNYTVDAFDAVPNTSAKSAPAALLTQADTAAPSVPTNLASPTKTPTSVTLNWSVSTDNVGVVGYRVFRNGVSLTTIANTSYTVTGLTPGASYTFTVAAYDLAGNESAQSTPPLSVTTTIKPGDATGDGKVNIDDLNVLASSWKTAFDLRADFDHTGIVDFLDLSVMATNWEGGN